MACNCIEALKSKLAETNTVPISVVTFPQGDERLVLHTERIISYRDGKKATPAVCAHCPICGVHY